MKAESFFKCIDWEKLARKEVKPPIKPLVKAKDDYSNFDRMFLSEAVVDTPVDMALSQEDKYEGFTYTRSEII